MNTDECKLQYILNKLDDTDYSMAKLIHYLYSDIYCRTNDGNREKWFKWNGVHWHTSEMIKHELKIKLSEEVANLVKNARTKIRNNLVNLHDYDQRSFDETRLKSLVKIEGQLYNTSSKDKIIKECESLFFVNDFPKK